MWTSAMLALLMGLGFVGFALRESWPYDDELGSWALSRGSVILALGAGLFLLHGQIEGGVEPVPLHVFCATILAALLVVRFGEDRVRQVVQRARRQRERSPRLRPLDEYVLRQEAEQSPR